MEPKTFTTFDELMLYNPIVYSYMSRYMQDPAADYIQTLKAIIVALANHNSELEKMVIEGINNNPSSFIINKKGL